MEYFRVRNWREHQHYRDRDPKWVKLYTRTLDSYDYASLSDASKLLQFCIILLAAKTHNKIPMDTAWIMRRASLSQEPDLVPLFDSGFIENIPASELLSSCYQDASPEKSRGENKRKEADGINADFRNRSLKADAAKILKRVPK